MRSSKAVLESPDFRVSLVTCAASHRHWSAPEENGAAGVVLVRRGMFRLLSDGRRQTVDPTLGYLQVPGREQRFAHPAGGDVCTFIWVRETLWHAVVGDAAADSAVVVDARVELAHRLLLRTRRDAADPAERLVHTLVAAARPQIAGAPGHADLADRAREAVLAGEPDSADLVSLAQALDVSPWHLSRTFHRHVGMTLSRYRNRVRVSRALARIEEGDTALADLAADVGFADQSHLTRTLRAELGHPPSRLRHLFS
ncbi:helix-turn-helix transcriptional regulator [Streptosporangiaceae bacterium NEAU-GS5]|nr:helix-turn-helix transcriptional regulator [Streptosporangiaceae bacterium NEAU-GS5]